VRGVGRAGSASFGGAVSPARCRLAAGRARRCRNIRRGDVRRPERGVCWAISRHPTTAIEQALDELGPLPVLTGTVASVRALATDPETSNEELSAAIELDEAFAASVLRLRR